MFKTATLAISLFAATSNAFASILPSHHEARFLQEIDALRVELLAWKQSEAGQIARTNGYYTENNIFTKNDVSDAHLERFFMTKLSIEKAQALNPNANFSIDSPFTLMSDEEFAAFLDKSYSIGLQEVEEGEFVQQNVNETDIQRLSGTKDWSQGKCVSPVKNQGLCSSCWAFASVGALESAYCLKKGNLKLFSEQQVTSCDKRSSGCSGGWPGHGLNYIKDVGGICTAASYPYISGKTHKSEICKGDQSCTKQKITIQNIVKVASSEAGIIQGLTSQPIAVVVSAANPVWKQYSGGVITSCPTTKLDHAVLAVGYGVRGGSNIFKIKNSWSTSWGEQGYIYLERNACGVTKTNAMYPQL
jgi:C1A family cysteine protease